MKSACRGFNQLSTTRVAGWGLVGWPGELVPKKAVFRPELCWLIFWTFISHLELSQLEHFISHLELLYPAKSTFISLLVHGPCKELCSPAIFFLSKALQNSSHNYIYIIKAFIGTNYTDFHIPIAE